MAIASMVCGIVGLFEYTIFLIFPLMLYNSFDIYYYLLSDFGLLLFFYSFILFVLGLIFGIIGRKKGKGSKNYSIANSGFIMGLIGLMLNIALPTSIFAMERYYLKLSPIKDIPDWGVSSPRYSFYNDIGLITTKTFDNYTVKAEIILGCDLEDSMTLSKLADIQPELQSFFKDYFSRCYADELHPVNEYWIKANIMNLLNMRFPSVSKLRVIFFNQLDIIEDENNL